MSQYYSWSSKHFSDYIYTVSMPHQGVLLWRFPNPFTRTPCSPYPRNMAMYSPYTGPERCQKMHLSLGVTLGSSNAVTSNFSGSAGWMSCMGLVHRLDLEHWAFIWPVELGFGVGWINCYDSWIRHNGCRGTEGDTPALSQLPHCARPKNKLRVPPLGRTCPAGPLGAHPQAWGNWCHHPGSGHCQGSQGTQTL